MQKSVLLRYYIASAISAQFFGIIHISKYVAKGARDICFAANGTVAQKSQKGETAQGRAVKLKDSILHLEHISRSSRSSNFDDDKLNTLLKRSAAPP